MVSKALFSKETQEWETPQDLFDELNEEFQFTLDVCATKENRKCERYFDKEMNGLTQNWGGRVCWMNPPYGPRIGDWLYHARTESALGCATVVCLLPARTDTKWFHKHVYNRAEIRFIKGRLKFGGAKNSAPFPSMIVIYRG